MLDRVVVGMTAGMDALAGGDLTVTVPLDEGGGGRLLFNEEKSSAAGTRLSTDVIIKSVK